MRRSEASADSRRDATTGPARWDRGAASGCHDGTGTVGPGRRASPGRDLLPCCDPPRIRCTCAGMTARLAPRPLGTATAGVALTITTIADEDIVALAEVGLDEGSQVRVERMLPLGGPVLLESGPARVAIARSVARRTLVTVAS
jgi:Fe2+ transport system protein FeoA